MGMGQEMYEEAMIEREAEEEADRLREQERKITFIRNNLEFISDPWAKMVLKEMLSLITGE